MASNFKRLLICAGALCAWAGLSNCLFDDHHEAKLMLEIENRIGGQSVVFDSIMYTNALGTPYSVTKLTYYLSNFTLTDEDGSSTTLDGIYFFDGRQPETLIREIGALEAKHYHTVSFVFGLLPERNIEGALPSTQDNINMIWPSTMGGGYHFMKLEGRYLIDSATTGPITTHIGMGPGGQENHFVISPDPIHATLVEASELHLPVIMNVDNWYRNPNNYDFSLYAGGMMQNAAAQDLLRQNGAADVFELGEILVTSDQDH